MTVLMLNGLDGAGTGDSLGCAEPLQTSGNVWYVSNSGVDAVSPAGLNASKPLLTLGQALTNAANHDIIALQRDYAETLAAPTTISKSVTIVGLSSSGGVPEPSITASYLNVLTISAAAVQLRGVKLTLPITVTGARLRLVGCRFVHSAGNLVAGLTLGSGADSCEIRTCEFVNASAATLCAIKNSAAIDTLRIFNTTVDADDYSFTDYYAVDLSAAAVTRAEFEGLSLLNGADMKLHASSTGWVNVELTTGGSRVDW